MFRIIIIVVTHNILGKQEIEQEQLRPDIGCAMGTDVLRLCWLQLALKHLRNRGENEAIATRVRIMDKNHGGSTMQPSQVSHWYIILTKAT